MTLTTQSTQPTPVPSLLPETDVVTRPWGRFDQLTHNETTTVKIITVEPAARLSLQRHEHRAERWQVLAGPLAVEVDGRAWEAQVGEVVWVPRGAVHRMANTGDTPAQVLEIGYGHFDEDDIERLQDDYARP